MRAEAQMPGRVLPGCEDPQQRGSWVLDIFVATRSLSRLFREPCWAGGTGLVVCVSRGLDCSPHSSQPLASLGGFVSSVSA